MAIRTDAQWCSELSGPSPDAALFDLHGLLVRGLQFALASYSVTERDLEDFVQDGLMRVLQTLSSYRGEARFTTWAQKVCVRMALTELRRRRWRDVSLDDLLVSSEMSDFTPTVLTDSSLDPGQAMPVQMMMAAVQRMIDEELTERNALYKLIHDGRQRLQKRMMDEGLTPQELLAMFDQA